MNIAGLPSRDSYEGMVGGWADGRLGQAYDLIVAVLREQAQHPESGISEALKAARDAAEAADCELEKFA